MEDFSIHWNARLASSSSAVAGGTCVVRDSDGNFLPATAANRTATGRKSAGIARSAADSVNASFGFQFCGLVPASLSGIVAGPQDDYVRVNASGRLERVTSPDFDADDVVGRCDADGTAYVIFGGAVVKDTTVADDIARSAGSAIDRVIGLKGLAMRTADALAVGETWTRVGSELRADQPTPRTKYDVKSPRFGAVGNGTTDDTAAINLAIAAANATGGEVYFPAGTYKFTSVLTTIGVGVWLRGVVKGDSSKGSILASYISSGKHAIFMGANGYRGNGIEHLTIEQHVDTAATYGTGGAFNFTTFCEQGLAAIEATLTGNTTIRHCQINGFPFGVILDGAESAVLDDVLIYGGTYGGNIGYSEHDAHGITVWTADGLSRNNGNAYSDATNLNIIRRCDFKATVWLEAGVSNVLDHCGFHVGVHGIILGCVQSMTLSNIYFEAGGFSGDFIRREDLVRAAGSAVGVTMVNVIMTGSSSTPLHVIGTSVIDGLTAIGCSFGGKNGDYCIKGALRIAGFVGSNCVLTNGAVLDFADDAGGGAAISHVFGRLVGVSEPGISINSMQLATAGIDMRQLEPTKPLVRIYGNRELYEHRASTHQKHEVTFVTTNPLTAQAGGDKKVVEAWAVAAGVTTRNIGGWLMPEGCLTIVKFTVLQWHSTDPTKYMYAFKKQKVYRYGAGIVFIGALVAANAADEPYEDTDGSFTAPTLVDDGSGNVAVHVKAHPTQESRVTVVVTSLLVRY